MQDKNDTRLDLARWPDDTDRVRVLFRAYQTEIGGDLCFKDFERELEALPGEYAAPTGCVMLAWRQGKAAGCVGLRAFSTRVAEMKRLYLDPQVRGHGTGRVLTETMIREARARGYASLRLDTLVTMKTARALYSKLGFTEISPYGPNAGPDMSHPDRIYLELPLS